MIWAWPGHLPAGTTLTDPVGSPDQIAHAARGLIDRELQPGRLFRLVGVGVSSFEPPQERLLQPKLAGLE